MSAKHIASGEMVAIKLIEEPFSCQYQARQVYREIKILRKLSELGNIFTPRIR